MNLWTEEREEILKTHWPVPHKSLLQRLLHALTDLWEELWECFLGVLYRTGLHYYMDKEPVWDTEDTDCHECGVQDMCMYSDAFDICAVDDLMRSTNLPEEVYTERMRKYLRDRKFIRARCERLRLRAERQSK